MQKEELKHEEKTVRVCVYCRIPTDSDKQMITKEWMDMHYNLLVCDHPEWDIRQYYLDVGRKKPFLAKDTESFMQMIAACRRGEYDLIVAESSRLFGSCYFECIRYVDELKALVPPVGVYFEVEQLNSLSPYADKMLKYLATFAEAESKAKSRAMKLWYLQRGRKPTRKSTHTDSKEIG